MIANSKDFVNLDFFDNMCYYVCMNNYVLYFDGSCPKNPGPEGGWGYKLYYNGNVISVNSGRLYSSQKRISNNVAEHQGLLEGLHAFMSHFGTLAPDFTTLTVKGDSQMVINQVKKTKPNMKPGTLYYETGLLSTGMVRKIRSQGVKVIAEWIPRENNQECDRLSKKVE